MSIFMKISELWPFDKRQSRLFLLAMVTILGWYFSSVFGNALVSFLSIVPMALVIAYIGFTCPQKKTVKEPEEESNAPWTCPCCSCCNFKAKSHSKEERGES